jgi:two-component system, OmpR family, alkaline phosphatase synthesis response regulator PhoP
VSDSSENHGQNVCDRKQILLAEDEEHIAKLVVFKLKREGFDVTVAGNGKVATRLLRAKPWAVIILDIMMPICDGWQVLKVIRSTPELVSIPVLMLSAKSHQKDMLNAAALGAERFLRKPFDPDELAELIKTMTKDVVRADWESDPELKIMKEEFVASFSVRRTKLAFLISSFSSESSSTDWFIQLQEVAHKLAGIAGSYGFPTLGKIAECIDEVLNGQEPAGASALLFRSSMLLDEALTIAAQEHDPTILKNDPRMKALISFVESSHVGSRSESS